jgi:hypothetical protein
MVTYKLTEAKVSAIKPRLRMLIWLFTVFALYLGSGEAVAFAQSFVSPSLDHGFRLLYDLDFTQAQEEFAAWERQHADDPVGPTAQAAGFLFSELHRLGILESQFYVKDAAFAARPKLAPDPVIRQKFVISLQRAQTLANQRLIKNPKDRDGLFAMELTTGLQADYAALVEKRNFAALGFTRQSTKWARQLLALDPHCYDAYLATGISKYLIGSMAAPVRWFLRLGGVAGDKREGITDLQVTAEKGHYLAPFARILLAIAYVRDNDKARAREVLASLSQEFPQNSLFAREMARLDQSK